MDHDRYLIPHGYYGNQQPGDIVLGGGCFEMGRYKYRDRYPATGTDPVPPDASAIVRTMYRFGLWWERPLVDALHEWVSWARLTPEERLDWRDRLLLEQRIAGWMSSVEQASDLTNATRFLTANSQRFFDLVLQIPVEKRKATKHQIDLIARMAPELLAFPFNPPDGYSLAHVDGRQDQARVLRRVRGHAAAPAGLSPYRLAVRSRRAIISRPRTIGNRRRGVRGRCEGQEDAA